MDKTRQQVVQRRTKPTFIPDERVYPDSYIITCNYKNPCFQTPYDFLIKIIRPISVESIHFFLDCWIHVSAMVVTLWYFSETLILKVSFIIKPKYTHQRLASHMFRFLVKLVVWMQTHITLLNRKSTSSPTECLITAKEHQVIMLENDSSGINRIHVRRLLHNKWLHNYLLWQIDELWHPLRRH